MKKIYINPEVEVVKVETQCILAESFLNNRDSQDIQIEDEILDGEDLPIF